MKKIIYYFSTALLLLTSNACTKFDNYEEPKETIKGVVIDKNTQKPVQTEVGEGGVRIKLMEYSWSESPTPYYFGGMQEGDFKNEKIFAGEYGITVMGAFVPVPEERYQVKGTLDLKLEVEPFLNVDWVGEPVINADKTVTVKATIKRGTTNPDYQQKVSDVRFFVVAGAPYVGENNKDDRYSVYIDGDNASAMLGTTVTLTTKTALQSGFTYHFRVGARMDKEIEGSRRYNYTEMITIQIP
ncbi:MULTISPECIES: DUF3823 domain-containing protein [Parabacteroides]|uniref:DUF3823 domain-containing protein n=2 Tax=Parabacteroides TaxID=375288 RepID=UPI0018973489|nr:MULTISPECIES: DUF3823 domain-containing protein [Parabacteroides]MCL3850402.1 DUF3823 domain-containing protein [Parabacteroides leei]